jgi:hypothetical protein
MENRPLTEALVANLDARLNQGSGILTQKCSQAIVL